MKKLFSVILVSILLTGCDSARVTSGINRFDSVSQTAATSMRQYYSSLNDAFAQLYFSRLKIDANLPASTTEAKVVSATVVTVPPNGAAADIIAADADSAVQKGKTKIVNTGLLARFDAKDIEARMIALDLLSQYTKSLATLASSDAPDQVQKNFEELSKTISDADSKISKLSNTNSLANIAGPVTGIAAIASGWVVKSVQRAYIKKSLLQNKDKIQQLFDNLAVEMDTTAIDLSTNTESALADYAIYYNEHFIMVPQVPSGVNVVSVVGKDTTKWDQYVVDGTRKEFSAQMGALGSGARKVLAVNSVEVLKSMKKTFSDLADAVEKGNKMTSEDWKALDIDMSQYQARVNYFKQSVDAFASSLKS
jgi:hypothetical protein